MSHHLVIKALAAAAIVVSGGGHSTRGGTPMEAKGTFEVKIQPAEATAFEKGMGAARYEVDKTWAGDFVGTSKGEMLSSFTESTGAMAYVAMEQMTGTLGGEHGTFYLAHRATMTKGDASSGVMQVVVVKGSGTGDLAGLRGELTIAIDAAGKHTYAFEYELH